MAPPDTTANLDEAVVIALGSNLARDHQSIESLLDAATARLASVGAKVVARSAWWRSAAWPDAGDPDYLNGVVIVETHHHPRALLAALASLERQFGRERASANAPRTLDLDLIAYGRAVINERGLTVPHPRAGERLFVMGPLAEVAPTWRHPVSGETAAALAAAATVGVDSRPTRGGHAALHNRPRNAI